MKSARLITVLHAVLLLAGLALIVRHDLRPKRDPVSRPPTRKEVAEVLGVENFTAHDRPFPHYRAMLADGPASIEAAVVSTNALPPEVKGYVDQVNALVVIDGAGAIRSIKVIESRETPFYLRKVIESGFLDRLVGTRGTDPKPKVDGVTGATITARAIELDATSAAALVARELFGLTVEAPKLATWTSSIIEPRLIAVAMALAVALFARLSKRPKRFRREAAWTVSLLLIGVYAMTPFTLTHVFQLIRLDWPGPANAVLALIAIFVFATTVTLGPAWCAYACPFGALQELIARLPAPKWKVSAGAIRWARELRYLTLFAATVGVFGFGIEAFAGLEPFGPLFARTTDRLAWAFIACVLFVSLFVRRFWCRFFCPTGACLIILSSHRRYFGGVQGGVDQAGIDRSDESEIKREEAPTDGN